MKIGLKKGADPSIILEIFSTNSNPLLISPSERQVETKKLYSKYFSSTSKETIKANLREDIIIRNQKKRFISKLPQDLKKLDLIVANLNEENNTIKITFVQQKGNNASFNSTSEAKTIDSIYKCKESGSYREYFKFLPDRLNPDISKKKYEIDFVIGMVNAIGFKEYAKNDFYIQYLSGDEYLNYIGLEIDTVEVAHQVMNEKKIIEHEYNAIDQCYNWDYIYEKCEEKFYGRTK
jgi:hypothetical protein